MKIFYVLFCSFIVAIFGNVNAQKNTPNVAKDTIWFENNNVLFCEVLHYGSREDTIQLVLRNNEGPLLIVINESIALEHILSFDSVVLSLIRDNGFARTDYKYPCNTLFTNNFLDSIVVHRDCATDSLTRTSLVSITNYINHYTEITMLINFFAQEVKRYFHELNAQYFMFIIGKINNSKSEIVSTIPSPSWLIVLDNKGNISKFQYSDSYILGKKEYNVNTDEMY